jgi:hypothetical protein
MIGPIYVSAQGPVTKNDDFCSFLFAMIFFHLCQKQNKIMMTFQYLAIMIGPGDSIQIFSQLMELNFAGVWVGC